MNVIFASFFAERKTPKELFQGEEETEGFLFPLKVTPNTFLMGKGDCVCNRVGISTKGCRLLHRV